MDSCLHLPFFTITMAGKIDVENSILFSVQDGLPNPESENYEELQDEDICERRTR